MYNVIDYAMKGVCYMGHFSLSSIFHRQLTLRLMIIIIYLFLIAAGNLLGVYDGLINQNLFLVFTSLTSVLLYAIPAYGLLTIKKWARPTELIISITAVLLGIILIVMGLILSDLYILGTGIFIVVIHGLITAYLLSPECKFFLTD